MICCYDHKEQRIRELERQVARLRQRVYDLEHQHCGCHCNCGCWKLPIVPRPVFIECKPGFGKLRKREDW